MACLPIPQNRKDEKQVRHAQIRLHEAVRFNIPYLCVCCKGPISPVRLEKSSVSCCGGFICPMCESKFFRYTIKIAKSEAELAHDRFYKRFLSGKEAPEVQCSFSTKDGMEVIGRLKSNTCLKP